MSTPKREYDPAWIKAALDFKKRWPSIRCKRRGMGVNWKDALESAWRHGWDETEPDGPLLRQLRNNYGPEWLSNQTVK